MRTAVLVALGVLAGILGTLWVAGPSQRSGPASVDGPSATEAPRATGGAEIEGCHLGVVVAHRAVDVAAQTEGLVDSVDVEVGDSVASGDVVARLEVGLLRKDLEAERSALDAAEAEVRRRRISVRRAESESARRRSLADVVSKEEIARAEADLDEERERVVSAEADVARLEARIARLGTLIQRAAIRAPFDGRVARRYLDPGARAVAGTAVLHLISDGDWRVRFAASLAWAPNLGPGSPVVVEVPERGLRVPATVEQVAPEIDPASRLVFVEARVDEDADRDRLQAGEAVRVSPPDAEPCPARY